MSARIPQARRRLFPALVAATFLLPASPFAGSSPAAKMPELPRISVDTTYVPPGGRTIAVRKGENFQAALDAAKPGDVIVLEAGATFTGPFTLPKKSGSEWTVVRSSAPEASLPPSGTRVDPSFAKAMPKLVAASEPVISAAPGAHHYRFIGIEIRPDRSGSPSEGPVSWPIRRIWEALSGKRASPKTEALPKNLVLLGASETSLEELPHYIIFDRCYIHGDPENGTRRGIAMNSRYTAVIDSYLSDFKEVGADSQAISGWNGPGPFKIVNNYLEGAGENVMFGGTDPSIADLVPSDIEIRGNHFAKLLSWKKDGPVYAGTPWTIKNLLELKNARRVLIDGNLFEYNWPQAQNGFAILFTVRNQDGSAPWSVVEDVTFINNVVRHTANGINILGRDNNHPSRQTKRILIKNNLFEDVGGTWRGGRLFQLLDRASDVVIEHNTALQTDSIVLGGDGAAHAGFVFSDNIAVHNAYGIIGSGVGPGHPTLKRYFPGAVIRKNVFVGGPGRRYPPENFFPGSLDQVGFVDRAGGNYRLGALSPYRRVATDGKDVGVDFEALCTRLAAARPSPRQLRPCALP